MKSSYFLLFTLVFSTATSHAEEPRLVFFGDSLTAGYGIGAESAYPSLIESKLKSKGHKVKVINAGVSGDTTAGGLRRVDWVLKQKVDVFLLALGANDSLRGLSPEEAKKNLATIVDKVLEQNPKSKIILAGIKAPPSMGVEYTQEFDPIYTQLAEEKSITLLPFLLEGVAGDPDLNLPDRIHPNEQGHERIAELVFPLVQAALSKDSYP